MDLRGIFRPFCFSDVIEEFASKAALFPFSCCWNPTAPPSSRSPCTLSLSHLAFLPRASLSQSADATEKRAEVNSLSPCFINNASQRLTEPVWTAGLIKGPEPFLYDGCTFARRRDLFNLGDKLLFDLVAVFIHLLMCRRVFFLSLSVLPSLRRCFS